MSTFDVLALKNCNILDVQTGELKKQHSIIIQDGSITNVGLFEPPEISDMQVIDMSGKWVMPGIIDLHVHSCEETNPKNGFGFQCDESEVYTGLRAFKNLSEAVLHGITTVRDCGAFNARNVKVRDAVRDSIALGPNVVACGYLITYPNGHICNRGLEVRGIKQIKEAVEKNVEVGANFIKVTNDPEDVEARNQSPDPSFTEEEFRCLVDEAHSNGMTVACHTFPSIRGINNALDVGVDTLEHAVPLNEQILERLLKQNAVIVPTFVAAYDEFPMEVLSQRMNLDLARVRKYEATNFPQGSLLPLRVDGIPESIKIWFEYLLAYLPTAIKSGVQIGIGTDAGCLGTNFRSALREMFLLTQFGATNLQVIQYATIVGARALARSDSLGKIEPGYQADMIFTEQNPIENLDTLLDVKTVIVRGEIINRTLQ